MSIAKPHLTILLDSSFIISLVRQRRDFEGELVDSIPQKIEIKILDLVIFELEHLARKSPATTRTWARAGLELIAKRDYDVVEHKTGPADVDSSLMVYARSEKTQTAVATVDRDLERRLEVLDIPVILPRRGHGLIVEGLN